MDATNELELRDYLAVLRRRRWIVVATTVLVVTAALLVSFAQTKIYSSSAELLLQPRTSEEIFSPEEASLADRVAVDTEIQVMQSRSVRDAVEDELGFEPDVSVTARGDTRVIVVTAEHEDPQAAAIIANTYSQVYIATRRAALVDDLLAASDQVQARIAEIDRELAVLDEPIAAINDEISRADDVEEREELRARQERLREDAAAQRAALQAQRATYSAELSRLELAGNLTQTGGAQLVSEAAPAESPVRPRPLRSATLAAFVGLLLGVGLAFVRDHLDDSVRTKEELERASGGHSVLGVIPVVAGWKDRESTRLVSIDSPASVAAEAYRTLRTSVQFLGVDQPLRVVQVTSANASEGKTTTLANLAVSLSGAGQRVIVVCCDLRRPRLHEFLGCDNSVGFTSVLVGAATLHAAVQVVPETPRLRLLASGPVPPNPSELLASARTKELFEQLKDAADIVLVDSPPILPVTDGLVLARVADATVVVASANVSTRKGVARTFELLSQVGAPVVGTVLNGVRADGNGYGYGYGAYTYAAHEPERRSRFSRRPARRGEPRVRS